MNDLTTQPPKLSVAYSATAELTVELGKILALVAPISMTVEQQALWLRAAVDSLEDVRPQEVAAVSAEIRRTVTRPSQIVPEIAKLVHQRRKNTVASGSMVEINAKRENEGLGAIHWVKRDGRTVCEFVDPPECSTNKRVK